MRNLKRALSLALATVMTVGMMVVGAGASYADVKATDNVEAIEVLQAVGIMTGDEKGNFNPDANVTRNEISVIMSNLLNLDYDYYRGTNPFTDVPSWAAPYVAACYAEGVTAGAGNGLYNGSGNVTAAEASLMIMKALGYFQYQNDFGDDWQIATIRQASYINLFDGINANAETALTRNQIAQLVLNGLKANMVTFTGSVGAQIGDVSVGYVPEYTAITNANKKYDSIDTGTSNIGADDKYYVQLGEELYDGDLKLNAGTDVFGRPAYTWEYKSKEIGTYVDDSRMIQEYTAKVTGDMLYDLLTRNTVNTYDLTVVIDGMYKEDVPATATALEQARWFEKKQINRNNDATLGGTGNGVLTQVFVDNDEKMVTVAIINTYLALANKDYDSKKDEIGFDVYGLTVSSNSYFKRLTNHAEDVVSMKVSGEDFAIADMKEKDAVLVTVADGEIQSMVAPEIMAGTTVDAFETGSNQDNPSTPSALEIDGTEYKFADAAEFDWECMEYYTSSGSGVTNLKDMTYNVYMDAYGYVIGVEEVEVANNYLFITGIDIDGNLLGDRKATANAIFLDGTMKTIDINMTKSDIRNITAGVGNPVMNAWCTYTVNNSNVYTVKEVSNVTRGENVPLTGTNTTKYAQYRTIFDSTDFVAGSNVTYAAAGDKLPINNRNISLDGQAAGTYARVYGTDNTVYLTVGVKEMQDGPNYYGYINDVDSVVTGIGNANLEVWFNEDAWDAAEKEVHSTPYNHITTDANGSNGAYSLYNDKGDIIACVVVGEDAGSTKNLVYAHTASTYRETYNATTDTWTWSRKVVSNGQEVILTEVGDGLSELGKMVQHNWYQVKYNAEGNVIAVTPASAALTLGVDYILDYDDIANAVVNEDTVLYYSAIPEIDYNDLKLVGKSLWLDSTATRGFRVADDVNVALIQYNNNVEKTYFETGVTSLKNIVNELNERHAQYTPGTHYYRVSAVLDKGVATSIVIYDYNKVCDPYTDGNWETSKSGVLDLSSLVFHGGASGMDVTFTNKTGKVISAAATADVVVKNASGNLVCSFSGVAYGGVGVNGTDFINFAYTGNPTNTGNYTVTLTIHDGTSTYVGTATLGTV